MSKRIKLSESDARVEQYLKLQCMNMMDHLLKNIMREKRNFESSEIIKLKEENNELKDDLKTEKEINEKLESLMKHIKVKIKSQED